jgi:hypothetical protein
MYKSNNVMLGSVPGFELEETSFTYWRFILNLHLTADEEGYSAVQKHQSVRRTQPEPLSAINLYGAAPSASENSI